MLIEACRSGSGLANHTRVRCGEERGWCASINDTTICGFNSRPHRFKRFFYRQTTKGIGMQTRIKDKWIEALRSGEYDYLMGRLSNTSGTCFCALGVLCDLFARARGGRGSGFVLDGDAMKFEDVMGWRESFLLPPSVMQWAGIDQEQEQYIHNINDASNTGYAPVIEYLGGV